MKILLSAYACEPGKGSEPEVGYRTALAAAERHDVWVVTRTNNLPALESAMSGSPFGERITLVGLDVDGRALRWKKRSRIANQIYYDLWQRELERTATDLNRRVVFDVTHHVTFAAYWKRTGLATLDVPFVWGPVGGGLDAPVKLYGTLGYRGLADELARATVRPAIARLPDFRRAQRSADVIIAQNRETAARFDGQTSIVAPNALAVDVPVDVIPTARSSDVLCIGQLIPLKGVNIAIRAFDRLRPQGSRLVIVGDGPERGRLLRLASSLGISERVAFVGHRPRSEVMRMIAGAGALLHTSLHEEAGLAVAEALSYGTPVVGFDRGGPAELVRWWPDVASSLVDPGTTSETVERLAAALADVLGTSNRPLGMQYPIRSYGEVIWAAYDDALA